MGRPATVGQDPLTRTTEAQRGVGQSAVRDLFRVLTVRYRRRSAGGEVGSEISLLGSTMYRNFAEAKPTQLISQKIKTTADLAALAQVYRRPKVRDIHHDFAQGRQGLK